MPIYSKQATSHLLLLGGDSALAQVLQSVAPSLGYTCMTTTRRHGHISANTPFLDLSIPSSIDAFQPPQGATAIMCASICNVGRCQQFPSETRSINVTNTVLLLKRLIEYECNIVFLSSSQVFDGERLLPSPAVPPTPRTEYGRQKLEVEQKLMEMTSNALVVRLSKVITPAMPLFRGWLTEIHAGRPIRAFHDLLFAPIIARDAMLAVLSLISLKKLGIWHISPCDELSYFQAAEIFKQHSSLPLSIVAVDALHSIPAVHYTKHAALDASATEQVLHSAFPTSRECMVNFINTYTTTAPSPSCSESGCF